MPFFISLYFCYCDRWCRRVSICMNNRWCCFMDILFLFHIWNRQRVNIRIYTFYLFWCCDIDTFLADIWGRRVSECMNNIWRRFMDILFLYQIWNRVNLRTFSKFIFWHCDIDIFLADRWGRRVSECMNNIWRCFVVKVKLNCLFIRSRKSLSVSQPWLSVQCQWILLWSIPSTVKLFLSITVSVLLLIA